MYKRPAIDENLYYEMAEEAARQKTTVKLWLEKLINSELDEIAIERARKEESERLREERPNP